MPEKGIQRTESAAAYGKELKADQADLTASIAKITGSTPKVLDSFTHAINGITVRLTRSQAQRVARIDGVTAVQVDFTRELTTDKGPEWIGAPTIWDGSNVPGGVGTKGEGILVGILDTGLNPANPSFADIGGDGYNHTNPLGSGIYVGVCDDANPDFIPGWGCNDKVIGYWDFDIPDGDSDPTNDNPDGDYDDDGHGSHTASTTAGNQVEAEAFSAEGTEHEFSVTSTIKGVAPHANIIGYDVCDGEGCQGSSIVAAIEQAIERRRRRHQLLDRRQRPHRCVDQRGRGRLPQRTCRRRQRGHVGRQRRPRGRHRGQPRRRLRGSRRSAPPPTTASTSPRSSTSPRPMSRPSRTSPVPVFPVPPTVRSRWSTPPPSTTTRLVTRHRQRSPVAPT